MDAATPPEPKKPAPPRDLRAELLHDLSTRFTAALNADASLPAAAQEALAELLGSEAPTAGEIIEAASKNDSSEVEVGDE